ncbi:MAG TPA: hypothetical protein DCQ64_20525 [Candidatus Rokubacteria bacterium]|nr:hypothetical protein [Candidatus Rokubacteria bacterium]
MAGERIVPGQEPEIAPGVHGYTMEVDGVLWVPLIRAASPGAGAVGRYLDALPRDKTVRFPTVLSEILAGMLVRRGFLPAVIWAAELGEWVDVFERKAQPAMDKKSSLP